MGIYDEYLKGNSEQEGYPGMPIPPEAMVRATPLTGLGGPGGNLAPSYPTGGGMPTQGPQDVGGMLQAGGRSLFGPGQNVLYRPASSYGVAGPDVFRTTYEKAVGDLNSRLTAYDDARNANTKEGMTPKAGIAANALPMDKYQQIAENWAREQREIEDKAAIAAQQNRVPYYGPGGGGPSGPVIKQPATSAFKTPTATNQYKIVNPDDPNDVRYVDYPTYWKWAHSGQGGPYATEEDLMGTPPSYGTARVGR